MEFRDLKKQYYAYKKEIDAEVGKVLSEGIFIGGNVVSELETRLADYVGKRYCISCANGTDALQLALMCWGIGAGDAVFIPDFTFFSTAEVVAMVGATPILVDISEDTFNVSTTALERAIIRIIEQGKLRPAAVIPVDLFGQPADYGGIEIIAKKYNLKILEDGAQGFGGRIGNTKACGFGDISTTSFFPAKPLGCYGDGGAIFTDNEEWMERIASLKVHGKGSSKYDNVLVGMNSRLDAIQAAVLMVKLNKLDEEVEKINRCAQWYTELLRGYVKCPEVKQGYYSSWAQYTILLKDNKQREHVQGGLKELGIPTMIYYAKGMHQQKALMTYWEHSDACPITESVCNRCLSLPMHPFLIKEEVQEIATAIKKLLA